ncbi:tRNA (adenosine(37)-N6)-threonylcarbamoyltransferase complex ATPase subunit type 1 TsaE [uncultured Tateyamaria sp.]|uniref:tRNA (adenosine(37)-N6)-threonylcarbamoyltransferase complex ATPase subunit type 1 TsaE n=1 Tax=uncultured Tateyamaria sp. TaxID=455651 RepID=UPI002615751B|nr:tRNA (adenosine(37)-N6)-threonylcarbamoyltransferase complex ATPase subunit type 1 TsaE [uncultured Tateyamaria sp.]
MTDVSLTLDWLDADATAQTARAIGLHLAPGDTVLLSGPVGAGKTHFARSLIQSILPTPEDVPSPTFTLVQTYDTTRGTLWHADLYRVSMDTEIDELGLVDAFEDAICLIEWPDRLGPLWPDTALALDISVGDDTRTARLGWSDPKWANRLAGVTQHA